MLRRPEASCLLVFLAALCFLLSGPARAASTFDDVAELARSRAAVAFQPADAAMPAELAALDYDGLRDILFRPGRSLWHDGNAPFEAMFFHRGRYHPEPVRIHEVDAA